MSIVNTKKALNFSVAVFSIIAMVTLTSVAGAQSASDTQTLMDQIRQLQEQIQSLRAATGTTTAVSNTGYNSGTSCSSWGQNLFIGSKGEDVRRLQKFLNTGNDTRVASSGVGSPGNETNYYGSKTADAVKRFQEKYTQQILTPVGLSVGTGYFYPSTRAQANKLCSTTPGPDNRDYGYQPPSVSTGQVTIAAAQQPENGYAIAGATRLPFTTFQITATGGDVRVTGVTVARSGLINDRLFENIYIVEKKGGQKITSERGLNSDSEATLSGSFVIRNGAPATLVVVADISTDNSLTYGGTGSLRITGVRTDTGTLTPNITGASHTFSNAVELSAVNIDNRSSTSTTPLDINDTSVEFFDADFENTSGDEDVNLFSITFTQKGSVAPSDFKEVKLTVEREIYYPTVVGDAYTFVFPNGITIRENNDIDVILEGSLKSGVDRSLQFVIEEPSDVYAVGRDYGYGVPITLEDAEFTTDAFGVNYTEISGGEVRVQRGSLSSRERNLIDGGDNQILGAFEIDVTGEPYVFSGLRATITLTVPTDFVIATDTDDEELEVRNIELRSNGQTIGHADDELTVTAFDGSYQASVTVDFDDTFELRPGEHEMTILGDLDTEFPDDARFVVTIESFDEVEGVTSRNDITIDADKNTLAGGAVNLRPTTVQGDAVSFYFQSHQSTETIVGETEGVKFGEIQIDTENSTRSVSVESITLTITATPPSTSTENANLREITNCRFEYNGNEVAAPGTISGDNTTDVEFDFIGGTKGWEVPDDTIRDLDVICDVDDLEVGTTIAFSTAAGTATTYVKYELDGLNDQEATLYASTGTVVSIVNTGTLDVTVTSSEDSIVATGNNDSAFTKVGEIWFKASNENIIIDDIVLELTSPASSTTSPYSYTVEQVQLRDGNSVISTENVTNSEDIEFKNINLTIEDSNSRTQIDVYISVEAIGENHNGTSGQAVTIALNDDSVQASGEASGEDTTPAIANAQTKIGTVTGFRSIPVIGEVAQDSASSRNSGTTDTDIYAFSITAEGEDVTIGQLSFSGTQDSTTIGNAELRVFTNSSRTTNYTGSGSNATVTDGIIYEVSTLDLSGANPSAMKFTSPVVIREGDTYYFELSGEVTVADGGGFTVRAVFDETASGTGSAFNTTFGAAHNFVWSPDSNEFDPVATSAADWFNGAELVSGDKLDSWTFNNES